MYYSSARFFFIQLEQVVHTLPPCVVPLSSVGVPADRDGTRVHDTPWKHRIHGRDAPRHCQPDAAIEIGIRGITAHEERGDRIRTSHTNTQENGNRLAG